MYIFINFIFKNFNVTLMLQENSNDDFFKEFETLYATVNSPLTRSQFSEEQKTSIRKVTNLGTLKNK